jgi:hypothetical protein
MERPRASEIASDAGTRHTRKIALYQLTFSNALAQPLERVLVLDRRAVQCAVRVLL